VALVLNDATEDTGIGSSGGAAGSRYGLTSRELEVVGLIATGCTDRDIATRLVLSERTVQAHVRNVFVKLDLHGRAATAAWAVKEGLDRQTVVMAPPRSAVK
jgi:DNA-binding NarL/FixJ family response regulator